MLLLWASTHAAVVLDSVGTHFPPGALLRGAMERHSKKLRAICPPFPLQASSSGLWEQSEKSCVVKTVPWWGEDVWGSAPSSRGCCSILTLAPFPPHPAIGRPGYLMRQKHPALPASRAQQQVLVLAEPRRKPSTFWHSISRLAPFRK